MIGRLCEKGNTRSLLSKIDYLPCLPWWLGPCKRVFYQTPPRLFLEGFKKPCLSHNARCCSFMKQTPSFHPFVKTKRESLHKENVQKDIGIRTRFLSQVHFIIFICMRKAVERPRFELTCGLCCLRISAIHIFIFYFLLFAQLPLLQSSLFTSFTLHKISFVHALRYVVWYHALN